MLLSTTSSSNSTTLDNNFPNSHSSQFKVSLGYHASLYGSATPSVLNVAGIWIPSVCTNVSTIVIFKIFDSAINWRISSSSNFSTIFPTSIEEPSPKSSSNFSSKVISLLISSLEMFLSLVSLTMNSSDTKASSRYKTSSKLKMISLTVVLNKALL